MWPCGRGYRKEKEKMKKKNTRTRKKNLDMSLIFIPSLTFFLSLLFPAISASFPLTTGFLPPTSFFFSLSLLLTVPIFPLFKLSAQGFLGKVSIVFVIGEFLGSFPLCFHCGSCFFFSFNCTLFLLLLFCVVYC